MRSSPWNRQLLAGLKSHLDPPQACHGGPWEVTKLEQAFRSLGIKIEVWQSSTCWVVQACLSSDAARWGLLSFCTCRMTMCWGAFSGVPPCRIVMPTRDAARPSFVACGTGVDSVSAWLESRWQARRGCWIMGKT